MRMKQTEEEYGRLWMRHRNLETKAQEDRRAAVEHKMSGTHLMKTAVYNETKCGRWLSIQDVANRLKVKREVAERYLRELHREGKLVRESRHDFAIYKMRKEE